MKFFTALSSKIIFTVTHSPFFILLARRVNRWLSPKYDVKVNVHGLAMYVRTFDRWVAAWLWKGAFWEGYQDTVVHQAVKKGMTVCDVGANIGYHTLRMAQWVGEQGRVFAFEPDAENYRLLVKNIAANNFKNVVAIQKAVCEKTGKACLYFCEGHRGDHRIFDSQDDRKTAAIETMAMDDFITEAGRVDFIKMDIQGAEGLALQGMDKFLRDNGRLIFMTEFEPILLLKAGTSPQHFLNRLIEYGFQLRWIDEKYRQVPSSTVEEILMLGRIHKRINLFLEKK